MARKKNTTFIIMGSGAAPEPALWTALSDAADSSSDPLFKILWYSTPTMESVVNWMYESESVFDLYLDGPAPKSIVRAAENVFKTDDLDRKGDTACEWAIYESLLLGNTVKALLLWDDDQPELMEKMVLACADNDIEVLDLGNGLVPIIVEDDEPQPQPQEPEQEPDKADTPFTADELAAMPLSTLKRIVASQGYEGSTPRSKQELIDIILTGDVPTAQELLIAEPVKVAAPADKPLPTMVVFYDDGTSVTINVKQDARKLVSDLISAVL